MNAGRLRKPAPLPTVQGATASAWAAGWYTGLAVGTVTGLGLAVLLGLLK